MVGWVGSWVLGLLMLPKAEPTKAVHVATSLNFYFELLKLILHGTRIFWSALFSIKMCQNKCRAKQSCMGRRADCSFGWLEAARKAERGSFYSLCSLKVNQNFKRLIDLFLIKYFFGIVNLLDFFLFSSYDNYYGEVLINHKRVYPFGWQILM